MEKQGALKNVKVSALGFFKDCILGKSLRTKFKNAVHITKGTLDYIHSDRWGPSHIESLSRAKYFLSLIDGFSRMVWVNPLRNKD